MLDSLHLCGFGWHSIGINDMHKEAWKIAKRILSGVYNENKDSPRNTYHTTSFQETLRHV